MQGIREVHYRNRGILQGYDGKCNLVKKLFGLPSVDPALFMLRNIIKTFLKKKKSD